MDDLERLWGQAWRWHKAYILLERNRDTLLLENHHLKEQLQRWRKRFLFCVVFMVSFFGTSVVRYWVARP